MADAQALALKTVFFNPAVCHAQGQFVFVANAVDTREAVVAEQRGVTEGVFAGVENRDIPLLFIWDIQIEEPRFQGLPVVFAKPLSAAIEVKPAIDTENRHIPVLGAAEVALECQCFWGRGRQIALAFTIQIKIVVCRHVFERRRQVAIGSREWQADLRRCI
ncbi:hypothetical protein D3C77_395740 [compost metagenome]